MRVENNSVYELLHCAIAAKKETIHEQQHVVSMGRERLLDRRISEQCKIIKNLSNALAWEW